MRYSHRTFLHNNPLLYSTQWPVEDSPGVIVTAYKNVKMWYLVYLQLPHYSRIRRTFSIWPNIRAYSRDDWDKLVHCRIYKSRYFVWCPHVSALLANKCKVKCSLCSSGVARRTTVGITGTARRTTDCIQMRCPLYDRAACADTSRSYGHQNPTSNSALKCVKVK